MSRDQALDGWMTLKDLMAELEISSEVPKVISELAAYLALI